MKKGFKIFISILLVLCILGFGFTYYYLYIYERPLVGEKLTEGLYLYKLDLGEHNHTVKVVDNSIYYYIEENDKYEFYEVNLYNNKTEKLGEFTSEDSYCYLDNDYIQCAKDNVIVLYDYEFKKIYEGDPQTIIPYKKGFAKVKDNIIYLKDKEYKKINKDLKDYNIYRYETFDDNLYIFFSGEEDVCLLNVNENKCEDYEYRNIIKYNDGLYYVDKDKIHTVNVKTNEVKEYDNFLKDELLTLSQLDNNLLYYFSSDYLRIYNLENGKVNLFDYRINEYVDEVYLNKDLLYLITNNKVYILKLSEITTSEMTIEELETEFEKRLSERIEKVKSEYNVDIKIRKEANLNLKIWDQKMVGENDYNLIIDSLDDIEEVLDTLGQDFFKEFVHGEYTGVRIYLVSEIISDFSMSGEAFRYYDKYAVIAMSSDLKRTLYHELMHSLEDAVEAKNKTIFSKWNSYNPKGYKYKETYDEGASEYKYTAYSESKEVYFIDNYSQTNGLEDRARIFENLCMQTTKVITENPNILKKAKYLKDEIIKYYPMLKDNIIFESLK